MVFETHNSVYELDTVNRRVRRIRGANPPTAHFSPDGEWKDYADAIGFECNNRPAVYWSDGVVTTLSTVNRVRSTLDDLCGLSTAIV